MKLIFIRHGDPDYVKDSLTEKGWAEAEILSERVAKWDIKDIYLSPFGRAQDTASLSLKKLGREGTTLDWLKEFYYRVTDEDTGEERIEWDFYPRYFVPHKGLHDKDEWFNTPIMKTGDIEKYYLEVIEGIDKLLVEHGYVRREDGVYEVREHNDDNLVFFCHFGITALITGYLTGIAAPSLWQGFFMAPTSITVLGSEERIPGEAAFRVQSFGDFRHLIEAGEPVSPSGYFTDMFEG
ncbi:MAG: histidine phosphatase family protein [Saccharofermentans sp.]|nr:histidine phosphatase family protein [Saccharofermentans sp.]